MVKALGLEILYLGNGDSLHIETSEVSRPGLQLAGYWDYFARERTQLIGKAEASYLETLEEKDRRERIQKLMSYDIPCVIICRGMDCFPEMMEAAQERGVPIFRSKENTTMLQIRLIVFLNSYLAPRKTIHGVLVDIAGIGMLITGDSGVGKSEAALELIKRGHRLVADDVVDVSRVNDERLVGEAPEAIRHFMEIRGIGIIDIATMYGAGAIIRSKSIDMNVHLELWQKDKEYERLGLEETKTSILGVEIPQLVIPIHPGRNLAVVLEVAARNLRLKQMGFNAAEEIERRLNERLMRGSME
ncbi:MAG: HPr(Ser) kinase/phosphatase [Clostridiales bacterium]|nr:HPr(Ser) kinase/phosphatase [Clostridiales bacterium]